MKLEGDYLFDASVPEVWSALFDPVILAAVMPGCEKLELVGDQYVGDIKVKVGPIQGKFTGKVDLKDKDEPRSYTMIVDGRGAPGFVKATAAVKLAAEGDKTRVSYDTDAQIGGKIASVGQRLIDASSRAIVKQSLEGLHQQIKALAARQAAATASSSPPALSPTGTIGDEPPDDDGWPSSDPPDASASGSEPSPPVPAVPQPRPAPAPSAASPKPKSPAVAAAPSTSQAAFVLGVAKEVTKELFPVRTVLLIVAALVVVWLIYRAVSG